MIKDHYVAWECGQGISKDDLDDCALQGPHTREKALKIMHDLHTFGLKASVIYSSSLRRLAELEEKLTSQGAGV